MELQKLGQRAVRAASACAVLLGLMAAGQDALAGIANTRHNLSNQANPITGRNQVTGTNRSGYGHGRNLCLLPHAARGGRFQSPGESAPLEQATASGRRLYHLRIAQLRHHRRRDPERGLDLGGLPFLPRRHAGHGQHHQRSRFRRPVGRRQCRRWRQRSRLDLDRGECDRGGTADRRGQPDEGPEQRSSDRHPVLRRLHHRRATSIPAGTADFVYRDVGVRRRWTA